MRSSRLAFVALGLDHTTAGVGKREQFAFADDEIPTALRRLTHPANGLLDQAAILSTCNRVEIYGVSRARPSERQLTSFLARHNGLQASDIEHLLYTHRDDQVARHLAATAAGMNSLVLGEAQILGQVRAALEHALGAGTAGTELRRLFESAIAAARRVRAGTAIGRGAASVPLLSVEFARRRLGTLSKSAVLLIGTGQTATLVAKHVVGRGAMQLIVADRTPSHARRLAESCGGVAITIDLLDDALVACDVVISATSAPRPILDRDRLRRALDRRGCDSAPLLLIDLAVPRDVDPAAAELSGVEIRTVDDFRDVAERTLMQRRGELPEAHRILAGEVGRFTAWLNRRDAGLPTCDRSCLTGAGR